MSIAQLAEYVPLIFRDPDSFVKDSKNKEITVSKSIYILKKGIQVIGTFTDAPTAWAAVAKKIQEFILPYFAAVANASAALAPFGAMFSSAFLAVDLGECWNDCNYFANGGVYEDLKKGRVASLAAHILLVPTNLIGTAVILDALELAQSVGNIRIFAGAVDAARYVKQLPLLGSIPKLTEAASWIGQVRVFRWIPHLVSYGRYLDGLVTGIFGLFLIDAIQRATKYHAKMTKNLAAHNRIVNQPIKNDRDNIKVENEKRRWQHLDNQHTQAICDVVACFSELLLKGVAFAGVTSLPVLFVLGAFSLGAVGTSIYYRMSTEKPEKVSILAEASVAL
jgi:hypothetical protein